MDLALLESTRPTSGQPAFCTRQNAKHGGRAR